MPGLPYSVKGLGDRHRHDQLISTAPPPTDYVLERQHVAVRLFGEPLTRGFWRHRAWTSSN
jgi:hypothetical protein